MADYKKTDQQVQQEFLSPTPTGSHWIEGFGKSLFQSTLQPFGFSKSPEVQRFEAQNPGTAFATGLAGGLLPYVGWEVTLSKTPGIAKKLESVADRVTGGENLRPISTQALREVTRYAPVEVGKIATALGFGDRPVTDVATESAINLGLAAGVGAGLRGLKEYGEGRQRLSSLVPGARDDLAPQLQIRAAQEALAAGKLTEQQVLDVKNRIAEFQRAIRLEDIGNIPNARYVGDLEGGADAKDLSRLFEVKIGKGLERRKFVQGSFGFQDIRDAQGNIVKSAAGQIEDVWQRAGFGKIEDAAPFVQFPRYVKATSKQTASIVQKIAVQSKLENVADGVWLGREANDRLYVMAKKISGDKGKGNPGDEWLLFKTDSPGRFLPEQEAWASKMADRTAWNLHGEGNVAVKPTGATLFDYAQGMTQRFPVLNYLELGSNASRIKNLKDVMAKRLGLEDVVGGAKEAFGDFFNRYFTPAQFQFGSSPRANWINGMSRAIFDQADMLAKDTMYGKHVLGSGNLFKASVQGARPAGGGIKEYLAKLSDTDVQQVWRAWNNQMDMKALDEAFAQGDLSKASHEFLRKLDAVDGEQIAQIQATQAAYGEKLFQPRKNHFMISRTWMGDQRVMLFNDAGKLVYVASGKTKAAAENMAKRIIAENPGWTKGQAVPADKFMESPVQLAGYFDEMALNRDDYFRAAKVAEELTTTHRPKFFEQRKDIGGYVGQRAPWSRDELEKLLMGHLERQNKYLATLVTNHTFAADMFRLRAENPAMFSALNDRLLDLQGKPGPLAQIQNKLADKVLVPVLGNNSATKIVQTTNELMMHFNLGALNFAQPVMNMLTFMQTVVPEVAFALNAVPERLGWAYGVWPLAGGDGMVRGSVHALDPLRVMKKSVQEMRAPSKELFAHFERAANEGVIAPRMVEDYIGESAAKVQDLRRAISSGENFVGWMKALSETLLSGTEKLSRGNAFSVGHIVGRDFFQLRDEQLYQFAKKFTQRTMYGYGTADRARIFTTPTGSALGLFKNWMTHYLGTMLEYTNEGLMRDNWSPLLWQLGGTAAVGGVAATGPVYYMADQFSKVANNKSLMENTYDLFGGAKRGNLLTGSLDPNFSDAVFFGLPTFFGISLSSSGSAPGANPGRDATMMFSFVQLDRMNALGRAIGGAIDQAEATGMSPFTDRNVQDQFARALAPKTVYRIAAAWNDKAIRSLSTSAPQIKDASLAERVAYMSGLNPTYIERQYRVADQLWNEKKKMQEAVSAYGEAFYHAQQRRDRPTMNAIMLRSQADGIDFSRVLRSVAKRHEMENKDAIERAFGADTMFKRRNMLGE